MANLQDQFIDESFQKLLQVEGSTVQDGTGSLVTQLDITASNSNTAISSSHSLNSDTSSLLLGNAEQVSHIDFAVGGDATVERRLTWNDTDGTLNVGLKGGNVTLQVGQEEVARVVNGTGGDLLEAQYRAVKVIGAQGQRLQVDLAQADSDVNSATTIGLVTENIANNQEGFITTQGTVNTVNTTGALQGETWNDGDVLYLSPTTPGAITNVKPATPGHLIVVGFVEYAHQNNGKIYVKVDNGYELEELHDVLITSASNGQALVYENGIWINSDIQHVSASYAVSSSHSVNSDTALTANTATTAGFASAAATASYVEYTNVANKPTLVSGSGQIDVSQTTGNISGARVSGPVSDSVNAVTASYAQNAGTWDGQYTGDAGITGSLTFTGTSATLDMGTGVAAQIKSNNITGSWGQTNPGGGVSIQAEEAVSASSFIGPLTGNADTATNLTPGAKTHDGVIQQTVPIPALFGETDFYTVTGANAGVYHIGLQDYTGFGVKFAHQGYMSEQFDSLGFNYGTAIGNSLTGVGFFMITSGSGEQVGLLTEQLPGQSKTTTDLSGHTTTLRGLDNIQLSGSVFSQNNITAPTFIGSLNGNADTATTSVSSSYSTVAENLTPGNKTHAGSIKQTFAAPATNTQIDLIEISGATGGNTNAPYNNFTVGVQDYPGFGNTFQDVFAVEKYDSFGYNYGSAFYISGTDSSLEVLGRNGGYAKVGVTDLDNGIVQTVVRGNQLINFANGAGGYTDQFYDHPTSGRQTQIVLRELIADNTQSEVGIDGDNINIGTDVTKVGGNGAINIGNNTTTNTITLNGLGDYADDATAASNGIPINGVYRTGNVLKIRIV